jgi:hypothetical protein
MYKTTVVPPGMPLEYIMCLVPYVLLPNSEKHPIPPLNSNMENFGLRSQNLRLYPPESKTELQRYLGQLLTYAISNGCGDIRILASNILLALNDIEQIGNDMISYIKAIANYSNNERRPKVDLVSVEYFLRNGTRTIITFFHQDVKKYTYIEFIFIVAKLLSDKTSVNQLSFLLCPLMVFSDFDHYDMAYKFFHTYVAKTIPHLSLHLGLADMNKDDILYWGTVLLKEITEQKTKAMLQFAMLLIRNTLVNSINDLPIITDSIDVLGDLVNANTFPPIRNT